MPSFLKDLSIRRRSRSSFKPIATHTLGNTSSTDGHSDEQQTNKSSSTLNSFLDKASTPTTLSSQRSRSSTHLAAGMNGNKTPPPIPPRPRIPSAQVHRYSLVGTPSQAGESAPRPASATSPLAPRVLSVSDGSWVHNKVLLIFGECADVQQPIDGSLIINHHQDNFPPTQWPVSDSYFKALVYLQPGPNRLRLDFTSQKLAAPSGQSQIHSSWINVNFLPLTSSPPLQLCILVAKDSPQKYDAVPERVQKEGNGLDTAIRKFRMAAYLWQAFTAEQMNRNGFGRRSYRYEEEWQPGTLTWRDLQSGTMRNEIKIHVVKLDKTVKEIIDLDLAQQYEPAKRKGDLFGIASDAVRAYFAPRPGQRQYVSCMFLDTRWDNKLGTIRGHAALGGGDDTIKLAIFGSHCLQSYPAHIEEVVPAFTDCTRTDTQYVANDCNEAGSNWEAANIGIGAHLHETGHLLGCPHQESGIMLRDYTRFNRTFLCREPYSTRTREQGKRLCLPKDECNWHRLDALRFRFHPCFQLPADQPNNSESSIQVWTVDHGTALVTAGTGVAWIEMFPEGDGECHHWIEYIDPTGSGPLAPRQVTLAEQDLRDRLPPEKRKRKLKLKIFSCSGSEHELDDFSQLTSKDERVKLPDGRPGFRSAKLGFSQMEGSRPFELTLGSCQRPPRLLRAIRVFHGGSLDGLEFFYEDGGADLFGKRGGGKPSDFLLDTRRGEMVMGFYLRAGLWIDGIQILTSTGRRSEVFGNADGGSGHTLIPPRGYSIAGIYGSCGPWIDGFGLINTR